MQNGLWNDPKTRAIVIFLLCVPVVWEWPCNWLKPVATYYVIHNDTIGCVDGLDIMQLVQHDSVSSPKIKNCAFLLFPRAQNVNKTPLLLPFKLQPSYQTVSSVHLPHWQPNVSTFSIQQHAIGDDLGNVPSASILYCTSIFIIFYILFLVLPCVSVQRDFVTNIMFVFLQQFTRIMFYTCLCLNSEHFG